MSASLPPLRHLAPLSVVLSAVIGVATLGAGPAAGSGGGSGGGSRGEEPAITVTPAVADCEVGSTTVRDVAASANWAPLTPRKWRFTAGEVIQAQPGVPPAGPRRPHEYAVLRKGPEFASMQLDAEVRLDTPVQISNRDVVILFGYQSPTRFYYVHLSSDNTIYPHNGIFLVDNADRLRIDDQWNGSVGAPPAITDAAYHRVRVRHCVATGEMAVYVDGAATPLMTATDSALEAGRVGFGSFDNIGRMRNLSVTGTPGCNGAPATIVGTDADDQIAGTAGRDVIAVLGGRDTVRAAAGNDVVCGGDGDDTAYGQAGDDFLFGEAGVDQLDGGPGRDTIRQD
jgi:RTX calcium-binding nonapeptide repeat (4 copies)